MKKMCFLHHLYYTGWGLHLCHKNVNKLLIKKCTDDLNCVKSATIPAGISLRELLLNKVFYLLTKDYSLFARFACDCIFR